MWLCRGTSRCVARHLESTYDIVDVVDTEGLQPTGKAIADVDGRGGIDEEGCSYAKPGGACEDKLGGVLPGLDTAHADDGDVGIASGVAVDDVCPVDCKWSNCGA